MPKITNTRAQRAAELLKTIERGPSSLDDVPHDRITGELMTAAELRRTYALWFTTWIRRELVDLVPELRTAAKLTRDAAFARIVVERAAAGAAAADEPSTSSAESENDHA